MLHLSTFNFNMTSKFDLRWVIWALLLLIAYILILPSNTRKIPDGVLTIFQAHRVTGEDYLLRGNTPDAVIVGSSLSAILPEISLTPVYNLALSGGSVRTGLHLIVDSKRYPKILFVETNVLFRDTDKALLTELFNPIGLWTKEWCNICRTKNQPITLLLSALSWIRTKETSLQDIDHLAMTSTRNEIRFQELLRNQLQSAEEIPHPMLLKSSLDDITQLVTQIQKAGTKVVFIQIPMDDALNASTLYSGVLQATQKRFPRSQYDWIIFDKTGFRTSDGAHLLYPDAKRIAAVIADKAKTLTHR